MVVDTRMTEDKLQYLKQLAEEKDKWIFTEKNRNHAHTAGTLICIPKTFNSIPMTHRPDEHDRYNFISLISGDNRKWIIGSVYMRIGRMKSIKKVDNEYDNITAAVNKIIIERDWNKEEVNFLIGGDFNSKLDYVSNKNNSKDYIEMSKCKSLMKFIDRFNLIDTFRSNKNKYKDGCGKTCNPRRATNKSSRLDYILMSDKMVENAQHLQVSVLPCALIESDHNLLSLKIIIGKPKPSRTERK